MLLCELFKEKTNNFSLKSRLQQAVIDFLTPLVAHKVPFVTVQQMIDEIRNMRPGLLVDRSLIMTLLDPDIVKTVKSIEGDRIYLQQPEEIEHEVDDDSAEKEVEKIKYMAKQKAKKDITKK